MKSWNINELETRPRRPEILASSEDARVIVLALEAGESLEDHQVHERAWLVVVAGEITVTALDPATDAKVSGGVGTLIEIDPAERHRVDAHADSRFLLMLTPFPGEGHPGAMSIEEKAEVRERAAERGATGAD
jgi:quercetin dioxygenase-like cupin family protein